MAKILYIEDDLDLGQLLGECFLASKGFLVELAHDGREGIRKAREWQPDLILLDIILPTVNGFDVMKHLKKDVTTQNIPVIAVSAMPTQRNRQLAQDVGIQCFVAKPFHPNDLLNLIYKHLP